ncbi:MAG: signal peptidase II [Clostridium fessum]
MNTKLRQFFIFFIGLGVSIGLDQFTKHLAVVHLKGQKPFVLIKGVFEFYYSENRGAAFGMLQGRRGILLPDCSGSHSGSVVGGLPDAGRKRYLPLMCSLFLLVSGAVGNMIDRLTQKYVVDFLYFKLIDFPIFNVADCYVVIATFLADPSVFLLLFG